MLMGTVLMLLFSYLLGSLPTGFLLGILSGTDVRKIGSGNIGATNVARVAGWKLGITTLLADAAKGLIPVLVSIWTGFSLTVAVFTALAAFLGHLYPVFLKFKGGKGVATALGVLVALAPMATAILLSAFALVAAVSRTVSLASLTAAALAPLLLWLLSYPQPLRWMGLALAMFIFIRHRENIRRLISGNESRFGTV
jgi:glycerol-3-phosphate acyltransferase PlsY